MLLASGVSRMKASDANAEPRSSQLLSDEPEPDSYRITESDREIHSLYILSHMTSKSPICVYCRYLFSSL